MVFYEDLPGPKDAVVEVIPCRSERELPEALKPRLPEFLAGLRPPMREEIEAAMRSYWDVFKNVQMPRRVCCNCCVRY